MYILCRCGAHGDGGDMDSPHADGPGDVVNLAWDTHMRLPGHLLCVGLEAAKEQPAGSGSQPNGDVPCGACWGEYKVTRRPIDSPPHATPSSSTCPTSTRTRSHSAVANGGGDGAGPGHPPPNGAHAHSRNGCEEPTWATVFRRR
uniref:Uncharacterized protein n=1 Tax=Eutreptiella gymnastica TaxID=73025 RepID=A0A6U7XQX5_9EUGL|mmetsp:Transcript_141016/g.245794  ORF Transcript_141016/g.245794 Transcript_141016/m.245794 type:complete len:145 (+) Transcript_141016:232-666(+)